MLRIVSKRIRLPEPTSHGGRQRWYKLLPYVQEREARRSQEVFKSSGHVKIEIHGFHIDRAGAAILIIIEHDESAGIVRHLRDGTDVGTKSVLETHVSERHNECFLVNERFVSGDPDRITLCFHELYFCPVHSLPQPDVAHGRKLEFPHDHFFAFAEVQGARDAVDTG